MKTSLTETDVANLESFLNEVYGNDFLNGGYYFVEGIFTTKDSNWRIWLRTDEAKYHEVQLIGIPSWASGALTLNKVTDDVWNHLAEKSVWHYNPHD